MEQTYSEIENSEYRVLVRNFHIPMKPGCGIPNHLGVEVNLFIHGLNKMTFVSYDPVMTMLVNSSDVNGDPVLASMDGNTKRMREVNKINVEKITNWLISKAEKFGVEHTGDIIKAMGNFGARVDKIVVDFIDGNNSLYYK